MVYENSSINYGASPAIWNQTVLPVTRHGWTRPALIPIRQAGTRLTAREGWTAELTLVLVIYLNCLPIRRASPIQVVPTV